MTIMQCVTDYPPPGETGSDRIIRMNVLGPFELTCGRRPVDLQLMQITVILALWCARGPVERDNLVRKIWPSPAPGAWDTLRRHLSRIRFALAASQGEYGLLIIEPAGPVRTFQIASSAGSDAEEFCQQADDGAKVLRDGRYEEASGLLHGALSRWGRIPETGPAPLACVGDRAFAGGCIAELSAAYKVAMLDCMKADISLGRHQRATAELRKLGRWYPGEPEIAGLLAIALYRCDGVAEASQVLRVPIHAASRQGIDTRRLRELQEAVLTGTFPRRGPLPDDLI
jgi:hypothetical protein